MNYSVVDIDKSILVGFAGKAGVGKTTIATEIRDSINNLYLDGSRAVKLSYAYPLKRACSELTGLPMSYFTDIELKEQNIPGLSVTPRILMQLMGTEFIREMIDTNFWIWRMRSSLSLFSDKHIFIDDVRFNNEAALIRSNGGSIVHLVRKCESATKEHTHKSESGVSIEPEDIIIQNMDILSTVELLLSKLFE